MLNLQENQSVMTSFLFQEGAFTVQFDDPSYVRADMLVIDTQSRSAGVILHEGYHALGLIPDTVSIDALKALTDVVLLSKLSSGAEFKLTAPLSIQ
jgi:hypothetical protein